MILNGWITTDLGTKMHCVNNIIHNDDGPAIIFKDGAKEWVQNGKYHREDGPALEYPTGAKYWWYKGKRVFCSSQKQFESKLKLKAFW